MKIEDAIKSKFNNVHQKALVNLFYTSSMLELKHKQYFKEYDLTPAQFNILRILRGQYPSPATVNLLIERMLDKSSNASRIVEKLKSKKLVERVQKEEDRRAVNVIITAKGLELLEKIEKDEKKIQFGINALNDDEASQLNELLNKIRSI
jgi:DNA-binding MarR family transcriptional regulator